MKKLNLEILKKSNILIYSVALLPIFSIRMVSISIMVFVLGAVLNYNTNRIQKIDLNKEIKLFVLYSFPFFLYLISLLWTDNMSLGLKAIEKNLSFIIFPFTIFILKPFERIDQVKWFYKVFIIATALCVVLTMLYLIFNLEMILSQKNNYLINIKIRQAIEDVPVIGEHAIYFSLLLASALLILFYNRFKNNWINIMLSIIFVLGILIASSKGVILAIIVVVILIVFQNSKSLINRSLIFFSIAIGLITISFFPPIKARINEIVNTKNLYPEGIHFNSFNIRMAIYNCSLEILKDAPIWGYGSGDVQDELDICYQQYNTSAFDKQKYNTHNQYFDYLASFGIIGFMVIMCCFLYYLKKSLDKTVTKLYFNFLVLFYVAFLTENILVRNTGIILFTVFNSLFTYSISLKQIQKQ